MLGICAIAFCRTSRGVIALTRGHFVAAEGAAILLVTGVTLYYTMRGGLKAVIWNDAVQLVVYVAGAALAGWILVRSLPGGLAPALSDLRATGKLDVLDFGWDWSNAYTFWAGLLGGAVFPQLETALDKRSLGFVQIRIMRRPGSI